jgi:uncharacterized membrane protein
MTTLSERNFHVLMGALLLGSTILDRVLESATPSWNPPSVSLVTLAVGLVWVALFAGYRGRNIEQRMRVLEDRLERSERRVAAMDAELADRRRPLI